MRVLVATLVVAGLSTAGARGASKTFKEVDGLVSMEAEHATARSGWVEVSGSSGSAMKDNADRGKGYLDFTITFTKTGKFYVYMLATCTSDSDNDAYFSLDGERLYGSDDTTRPEGMRTNSTSFGWSYLPKGPGGSTPANIKNDPVYFKVTSGGAKTLRIGSRSKGFIIDKVVMKLNGGTDRPTGTGPAETVDGGSTNKAPSASIASPSSGASVLPGQKMSYSGSGTDPEDGALSGSSLSWELDRSGDGQGPVHTSTGGSGGYTFPSNITSATTYTLTLTATDSGGRTGTAQRTVTVEPPAHLTPVADAGPDRTVRDDNLDDEATVTLDGSGSSDPTPGGSISSYVWKASGAKLATGVTPKVTLAVGAHVITLTVTGNEGATASDNVTITVRFQDDDGDGLADTWEYQYFSEIDVTDGTADTDDDGFTDYEEFLEGTDPTDAGSAPPVSEGDSGVSCTPAGLGGARVVELVIAAASVALRRMRLRRRRAAI